MLFCPFGRIARTVIDGGRTHHVACNMARTSAPSTNTLEIDVFGCSAEGSTRPVSGQITLCWTWNQSDVEEKCKKVAYHQMQLKQAQLKTTLEGYVVALESYNMSDAR